MDVDLWAVDEQGSRYPLPKGMMVDAVLMPPHQLDSQIEQVTDGILAVATSPIGSSWQNEPTAERTEWLNRLSIAHAGVRQSLYSFRYHERQFFARLRIVTSHYTFAFRPPRSDKVVVRFGDKPLESELEAVLIRTSSVLDALARMACFFWNQRLGNWGTYRKRLEKLDGPREVERAAVRKLLRRHAKWLDRNTQLRNQIVHESNFPGFEPIGHRRTQILDAEVSGVPAGRLVLETWTGLKDLVPHFTKIVGEAAARPS